MILCCLRRTQHSVRDRFLGNFPVLFDDVQFRAVRWKIEQAQRFAALAAKKSDDFAAVPGRVVDEQNKPRVLQKELSRKTDERFLRLP